MYKSEENFESNPKYYEEDEFLEENTEENEFNGELKGKGLD